MTTTETDWTIDLENGTWTLRLIGRGAIAGFRTYAAARHALRCILEVR